jgi:hypothetical protein
LEVITKQERYDRAIYELQEYAFKLELADTRDEKADCQEAIDYWTNERDRAKAALDEEEGGKA